MHTDGAVHNNYRTHDNLLHKGLTWIYPSPLGSLTLYTWIIATHLKVLALGLSKTTAKTMK